jgi:hypothetical protein
MQPTFPIPDPITPEWLTVVLRPSGVLGRGAVQTLEWEPTEAFNSATMRLLVQYAANVPSEAPTRLILKRNIADEWARVAGAEEVRFYTLIASLADHPPVTATCYAAAYDEASGESYLLLQDLSATHRTPVTREQLISLVEAVPTDADIDAVVETLAQIHAYWWDHPLLHSGQFPVGYWSSTPERFEQYRQRRATSWQKVIAGEGTWLPNEMRALYEQVLAGLPAYWEQWLYSRFQNQHQLTLNHGDAYFANFLCPHSPDAGPAILLDWQSPEVEIGAYDLVNLCATFWTPEQRHDRGREERILRHYLQVLRAHGVKQYQWEDLLGDYRRGLIFWLLIPVQDAADGAPRDYWWPKMQCLAAAFRDWHSADLLG